jgi:cell division protein FtsZ
LKKTRAHPPALPSLAQVIGVGGGGSNAVNRMMRADMKGIDLYVINTDSQVK